MSSMLMKVGFIAIGYAISSSCLVVINKWTLLEWPYPTTLTFLQLTVSWIVAYLCGKIGIFEVDPLDKQKMLRFAPACLIFFVALACNMKLLENANVDTFIVLRSLVPFLTTIGESMFLGVPLPGLKVFATLLLIIIGAVGYVFTDRDFSMEAYFWGFAYVVTMVVDTILVKKVVTDVSLTPWGLVLYNNLIASMLYPLFVVLTGEYKQLSAAFEAISSTSHTSLVAILASCLFAVAISYFGMNARKMLQATAFSVLGVVCKFATILVNTLIWEYHATIIGIAFMTLSLVGGILYQQVMKSKAVTIEKQAPKNESDIEQRPFKSDFQIDAVEEDDVEM